MSRNESLSAPSPDFALVDDVLRGRPGAVEAFHERHGKLIYACIRARAGVQDADDIFQAFFERLVRTEYRALRLWQRGTSLPVYLSRVIRNFVTDVHRTRRFREEAVGGPLELEPLAGVQAETVTAATHLRELRKIGLQAWSALESRDRRLVCDRLHRDLDNETIADRLNLSPGTLRTAMSRAQSRYLAEVRRLAPEFFPDTA